MRNLKESARRELISQLVNVLHAPLWTTNTQQTWSDRNGDRYWANHKKEIHDVLHIQLFEQIAGGKIGIWTNTELRSWNSESM